MIANATKVRQRFLRRAGLHLNPREKVAKVDQEPSKALSLVLRHCHDARDIVFLLTRLFFGEIANEVAALLVTLGQNIEEKRFHVVVEGFVVQEQLSQETQVLTVDLADVPVHLEDGEVCFAVDLVCRGVEPGAFGSMALEQATTLEVLETELTDV